MKILERELNINLPNGQSAFLWGARQTGKSTYLRAKFSNSLYYDFLKSDLLIDTTRRPASLAEKILAQDPAKLQLPIILDEVQKVPTLLDEVHWMIENKGLSFILCGSSARKLKRGQANLLGGRAWRYELFPLVSHELETLDLLRILNQGLIPAHYLDKYYQKSLQSYVLDYLREEVFAEGLTRNVAAFSRFFDTLSYSHGELINFANIARDSGVDGKTVREYFQILVDTLLGYFLEPYKKRQSRAVLTRRPKFYLFDVGVAGVLSKRRISNLKGENFGKSLEHFIALEIIAYRSYRERDFDLSYWRTKSGYEVDFILGEGEIAIEVKGTGRVEVSDLRGLLAFGEDNKPRKQILVCTEPEERLVGDARIMPWDRFLAALWADQIL